MKRIILVFGLLVLALLILFEISKRTYLSGGTSIEIIIAIIAITFFFIGIYIHKKSLHKNTVIKRSSVNHKKIKELNISQREYEVLCEIAKGLSNQEIATKLFVSESTIKTHVSNLFVKLNAKRRTQAIQISKELQLLPF